MKKKRKFILIIVSIVLIILLVLLGIATTYKQKENDNKQDIVVNGQSLASIINDLGSIFIKEQPSEESGFSKDIYLKFKYDLYENGESKERTYTNLILHIVNFVKNDFRLIDESRDIVIRVKYNSEENSYYYTVNGEEDYFKKRNSVNTLNSFKEFKNTNLIIQSKILEELIDENWKNSSVHYGSKESIYDNYDIYFDEGISVRNVSGKTYNIIFNEKYTEKILNNITTGNSNEEIKKILGEPTFSQDDIIGYKNDDIYVFFYSGEISVYRNEKYDCTEFEQILEQYISDSINVKDFTNKLTYLWSDYSSYDYNSDYVDLIYANQGIEINLDVDNPKNIVIYGNYSSLDTIKEFVNNESIIAKLDEDLVFLSEIDRISKMEYSVVPDLNKEEYVGNSSNFNEKIYDSKVEFYSLNNQYPSCRLTESINSYFWLSDNIFVYSISGKGIYYFNLENREKYEILLGDEDYTFNSYENKILNYDEDKTLEIGSD